MLVKIGSAFIDPAEIAAARHEPATSLDPEYISITLRSGECALINCSMEEFEAALKSAGLLEERRA